MVDFYHRRDQSLLSSIPIKANKLLQVILCLLVVIVVRIWHLSVIQHDKRQEEMYRSRKKVVIEAAERGTIRDRYNNILAENKMAYRASIVYNQIREVPSVVIEIDRNGNKKRRQKRKEYIAALAALLGKELDLDGGRLEDEIHSNAVFYGHIPYLIKDQLSEVEYYRLKMLSKDWPGLVVQRYPKRHYPFGRVGCDVIGYLGPMSKERYKAIINEIQTLQIFVKKIEDNSIEELEYPEGISSYRQAKKRLIELQERSYTMSDRVGRLGAELAFEEQLRGFYGKRSYFSDAKGDFIRELPDSEQAISGKRLYLSLSIELQEFAEKLLARSEVDRQQLSKKETKAPWIRGGAIVAMEPLTGEVIALASYPRFDPNDFSAKNSSAHYWEQKVLRWLQNEQYLKCVWNGLMPMSREIYDDSKDCWKEENVYLSWDAFIQAILPEESQLVHFLNEQTKLSGLIDMQNSYKSIQDLAPGMSSQELINMLYPEPLHKAAPLSKSAALHEVSANDATLFAVDIAAHITILDKVFSGVQDNRDKLLFLDLSRLIINCDMVDQSIRNYIGNMTIGTMRDLSCAYAKISEEVYLRARKLFRQLEFKHFREKSEKQFLAEKRNIEKIRKKHSQPYLEYLDREEKEQFSKFWKVWGSFFVEYAITGSSALLPRDQERFLPYFEEVEQLAVQDTLIQELLAIDPKFRGQFQKTLLTYSDLDQPLYGNYGALVSLKDLAATFIQSFNSSTGRSFAYRNPTAQGSIFKLVTSYAGLMQHHREHPEEKIYTLFEMTDQVFKRDGKIFVGITADGKPIPQIYKGGRIPKSLSKNIGKIDLVRAIETSSDPYFSLLAAEYLKDPEDLKNAAALFGYGEKTGIQLPGEASGQLPLNLKGDKTGLYAFAIGQGAFTATPLQSACMLSAIANGGKLLKPKIDYLLVGKGIYYDKVVKNEGSFPYKELLKGVGVDFPLFMRQASLHSQPEFLKSKTEERRSVPLPKEVRATLLLGMRRTVDRLKKDEAHQLAKLFSKHPSMGRDFEAISCDLVGKTSTAEAKERLSLFVPATLYNHIWFGGISFDRSKPYIFHDSFGTPDLVVAVYLPYGGYGKEAAPLAAEIVNKWRQIKQKKSN